MMQTSHGDMISIELRPQDLELLVRVLEGSLSDLHSEIRHTDADDYKEALVENQKRLDDVLAVLYRASTLPIEGESQAQ